MIVDHTALPFGSAAALGGAKLVELEHRTGLPSRLGNYVVRVDNDGALYAHHNARAPAQGDWTADAASTHHGVVPQPRATIDRVLRGNGFFDRAAQQSSSTAAAQGGIVWRLTYWDPQGTARSVTVGDGDPAAQRLIPRLLEALDLPGFPAA